MLNLEEIIKSINLPRPNHSHIRLEPLQLPEIIKQAIQTSDRLGLVTSIENIPTGKTKVNIASYIYDPISGLATVETDGNNNTKKMTYDAWGQLTSVINTVDGKNEITRYSFDLIGNIIKIVNADNTEEVKTYDQIGRLIQETNETNEVEKHYYDGNNNLIKTLTRNGDNTSYEYDKHNRLYKRVNPDETVTYAYDGTGKRTAMSDNTGTTTYQYDPYSALLTTVTTPDNLQLQMKYDANGNRTELKDPFGGKQVYGYDRMNRLQTIGASKEQTEISYSYYNNGNLHTTGAENGALTTLSYEGTKVNSIVQTIQNTSLNTYKYGYDNNGNLTSREKNSKLESYTYDSLNRISTSTEFGTSYTYDNRSNRQTMTSDQPLSQYKPTTYVYDKENRLTRAMVGDDSNYVQADYLYNGDGLLVERTALGETTRYYYDGDQIIAEAKIVNGKPELKARYIRGNRLEAIQYPDGKKAYVLYNGHGDIEELRDEQGNPLNKYEYDMWGNLISESEQVYNPFRYSGELWDDLTKLQYLRARWYDPNLGRILNEDTYEGQIDNPLTLNLYTYVGNNPLTRFDPSGHDWLDKLSGFLNGVSDELTFGLWTYAWDKVYTNRDDDYYKGYSSYLKYFTPQTDEEAKIQLIVSTVIGGSKINYTNLNKDAAKGLIVASKQKLQNALAGFKDVSRTYGGIKITADKKSMEHILERHTYEYWQGQAKRDNTFFDPSQSVYDIKALLHRSLNDKASISQIEKYNGGYVSWNVSIDGAKYTIGLDNYNIVQFFPVK